MEISQTIAYVQLASQLYLIKVTSVAIYTETDGASITALCTYERVTPQQEQAVAEVLGNQQKLEKGKIDSNIGVAYS